MWRFLRHIRIAFWRAFQHDAFAVAKAAAFSAILTLFPAVLVIGSSLSMSQKTQSFLRETSHAVGRILPEGTGQVVVQYFSGNRTISVRFLILTALVTLWTGSGVMISWMEGFRHAYGMPKIWGLVKERMIAFLLVILAGVPMAFASFVVVFGNVIERWTVYHVGHEIGPYILALWAVVRWIIAALTSVAVISLIYHHGVPRTQPWQRVLPGSALATVMWFVATVLFGIYVRRYAHYDVVYGSVGTAVALMIWLYLVSMVVLVGAEFNSLRNPRYLFGAHSDLHLENRSMRSRKQGKP
jgi:membrane protein